MRERQAVLLMQRDVLVKRNVVSRILQDQLEYSSAAEGSLVSILKAAGKSCVVVRHMAVTLYRVSQILGGMCSPAGAAVKQLNHFLTGADVAWTATFGPGLVLHHPTGVVVGADVVAGRRCRIQQGVTIGGRGGQFDGGSPSLGDEVVLGAGARILGRVSVGDRAWVGANSVVLKSIPADSVAVGAPARIVRQG